jgi:hypothetical protein
MTGPHYGADPTVRWARHREVRRDHAEGNRFLLDLARKSTRFRSACFVSRLERIAQPRIKFRQFISFDTK